MRNGKFQKRLLIPLICVSLSLTLSANAQFSAGTCNAAQKEGWGAAKIYSLEKELRRNSDPDTIKQYVNTQKRRSTYFKIFKRDNIEACDALRAALYFLRKDKSSSEYKNTLAKLNTLIEKSGFQNDDYNRLEVAKNLYLECEWYASAYEFEELIEKGFECAICLEYLGDIEQRINKDRESCLKYYKKSLEYNPNNASALFKIATVLNSMNRGDLALEYYTKAINLTDDPEILKKGISVFTRAVKSKPRNANLYEILGATYEKTGDYKKTYELYQRAIYLNPKDIFLKYRLGGLLYETKQYPQATRVYDNILRDNLYESQIRAGKAKSLLALGQANAALKEYQVILAIYPESKQAKYGIYEIFKGKKDLDYIIDNFYPLNENFKPASEFYAEFAELLTSLEGNNEDAISLFNKALALNPKNANAYLKLYEIYELAGEDLKAAELIKKAYKNLPDNEEIKKVFFYLNKSTETKKDQLALHYLKNSQWAKAIKIYEQIEPKTSQIYVTMAGCYKNLKNYQKSVECYKKALSLDDKQSDTYYSLALVYLEQKSPKLAQTMLSKAVELDPKNVKAIKLSNYLRGQIVTDILNEAYTYYDKKNYEKAIASLNEAAKRYPQDAQVYYYRGIVLEAMSLYPQAIKDYKTAVKLNRGFALGYYSMAKAYEKLNRGRDALECYEKYLSADPREEELIKEAEKKVIELGEKYY